MTNTLFIYFFQYAENLDRMKREGTLRLSKYTFFIFASQDAAISIIIHNIQLERTEI